MYRTAGCAALRWPSLLLPLLCCSAVNGPTAAAFLPSGANHHPRAPQRAPRYTAWHSVTEPFRVELLDDGSGSGSGSGSGAAADKTNSQDAIIMSAPPLEERGEEPSGQHFTAVVTAAAPPRNARMARTTSQIREIRSRHLVGVVVTAPTDAAGTDNDSNHGRGEDVVIRFGNDRNLVAVTGETASGKSLLVARVVELVMGGKASYTIVAPGQPSATVAVELVLTEPYLTAAEIALAKLSLDPSTLLSPSTTTTTTTAGGREGTERTGRLVLSRTLVVQPLPPVSSPSAPTSTTPPGGGGGTPNTVSKSRHKSLCHINGQAVTLKAFAALAGPLFAVVDAASAAAALAKAASRVAILDTAVPAPPANLVAGTRRHYRRCRRERERLASELANRALPTAYASSSDNDADLELLSHWIDELDAFEARVTAFCRSVATTDIEEEEEEEDALSRVSRALAASSWSDNNSAAATRSPSVSAMYTLLSELRGALETADDQLVAARHAADALSALSSTNSAATAVERARKFLFAAAATGSDSAFNAAAERSHELLNDAEAALHACARFLDDDEQGLRSILAATRARCPVPAAAVDDVLFDWKSLARKHGVAPAALPSCHVALRRERDGNAAALTLLPAAVAAEDDAYICYRDACARLSTERQAVATYLSDAVSQRMPSLGMVNAVFRVEVASAAAAAATDSAARSSLADAAEFLLLHTGGDESKRGGRVSEVASSGEKARLLLAIECALPGSIGASCSNVAAAAAAASVDDADGVADLWGGLPPIAVVYDEIDAHVGGRAAVSLANLLVDQSRSNQVIAITHSPSVAAAADLHVVIQKGSSTATNGTAGPTPVSARVVNDRERRRELARMASGDLAVEEAEAFAEALIREGMRRRTTH